VSSLSIITRCGNEDKGGDRGRGHEATPAHEKDPTFAPRTQDFLSTKAKENSTTALNERSAGAVEGPTVAANHGTAVERPTEVAAKPSPSPNRRESSGYQLMSRENRQGASPISDLTRCSGHAHEYYGTVQAIYMARTGNVDFSPLPSEKTLDWALYGLEAGTVVGFLLGAAAGRSLAAATVAADFLGTSGLEVGYDLHEFLEQWNTRVTGLESVVNNVDCDLENNMFPSTGVPSPRPGPTPRSTPDMRTQDNLIQN